MKKLTLLLLSISICILSTNGCKKDDNNVNPDSTFTLLTNSYKGQLHLTFTNTYPSINESTSIDVDVDKNGKMTFGIGGLTYFGVDDNGQSKIQRDGELIIAPNGSYFLLDDKVHFAVDENTMVTETFKVWYWNGSSWQLAVNETVSETWKDGLSFILIDAEISGSIVAVSTANGSITWTLTLSPVPE